MKHLLAGITVLAAAGAILGAAGYYVYKKNKADEEPADYEELIFTDDAEPEYVEVVEEVKDIVADAAEDIVETVSEAFEE